MSSRKPLFLFTTSDNHIGYLSVEQMTKEYYDEDYGFFAMVEELIEVNEIDNVALAITGDFFDHQLSLNSQHSLFAMDLIHSMLNFFVRKHKGEVILIRGTRSHDLNQLSIFEPFVSEFKGKFKILNTVEEIDIAGYATLCIPEEYMKNQEEYYESYFSKQYDLILGHGLNKAPLYSNI